MWDKEIHKHLREKAERKYTEDTGQRQPAARFIYSFYEVEDFYDIWRLSEYKMTLTGSYAQDRTDYPGFWEHDIPLYAALYMPHEERVREVIKQAETIED